MRLLILTASFWALALAKPEMYKESEDFQYSRSSSDDGTKSGFYGAQRGNMGGNYEKAHNMDSMAQHHMSTLVRQIDGELGEGANTKTGSVFTAGNSRGIYGSGNYDLSNLKGRNFGENGGYEDSQSQSSLYQNARQHDNSYYTHSAGYGSEKSHTSNQRSGYSSSNLESQYSRSNSEAENKYHGTSNYDYGALGGTNTRYYTYDNSQARGAYDQSNTNLQNSYDLSKHNRLTSVTPVKVYIRPGGRVALPISAPTYSLYNSNLQDKNVADTTNVLSNSGSEITYKPSNNAKHYESAYSYHKKWEKHDTQPLVVVPTENPFPANSELYEDRLDQTGQRYQSELDSSNTHSTNSDDGYSAHQNYQSGTQSSQGNSAYSSGYSANTKTASANQARYQSEAQNKAEGASSNSYSLDTQNLGSSAANLNNLVEDINSRPKSYHSSFSYHKAWERRGDPYVITPSGDINGQKSQKLTSQNQGQFSSQQYGSHYNQKSYTKVDCDSLCHQRRKRSYNMNRYEQDLNNGDINLGQQSEDGWDLGQQTENKFDNLEDLGQATQNSWDSENLGQQTQNQWNNLQNVGQETQNKWNHLTEFGQQAQNKWSNQNDLDQHTENQRSQLENLDQEVQNHFSNIEDLGQQTQGDWGKLEDLGQQTQSQWGKIEDLGQQTQSQWGKLEDLGQQTQSQWGKLEDLGQQTQSQWGKLEDLGQQTQSQWGKLEDLGQQTQPNLYQQQDFDQTHTGDLEDKTHTQTAANNKEQEKKTSNVESNEPAKKFLWDIINQIYEEPPKTENSNNISKNSESLQNHDSKQQFEIEKLPMDKQFKNDQLSQSNKNEQTILKIPINKNQESSSTDSFKHSEPGLLENQKHKNTPTNPGEILQDQISNLGQQSENQWSHLGQQSETQWSNLGQQSETPWSNLGQQSETQWSNLGQQSETQWSNLGQQSETQWSNLGQQSETQWSNLGQQSETQWSNLGQQSENQWSNLGQQSENQWSNLGQQSENQWSNLGQQSENQWSNFGQQSETQWSNFGQQTQNVWNQVDQQSQFIGGQDKTGFAEDKAKTEIQMTHNVEGLKEFHEAFHQEHNCRHHSQTHKQNQADTKDTENVQENNKELITDDNKIGGNHNVEHLSHGLDFTSSKLPNKTIADLDTTNLKTSTAVPKLPSNIGRGDIGADDESYEFSGHIIDEPEKPNLIVYSLPSTTLKPKTNEHRIPYNNVLINPSVYKIPVIKESTLERSKFVTLPSENFEEQNQNQFQQFEQQNIDLQQIQDKQLSVLPANIDFKTVDIPSQKLSIQLESVPLERIIQNHDLQGSKHNEFVKPDTKHEIENLQSATKAEIETPLEPTTIKPGFWGSVWNKTKNAKSSIVSWFKN